MRKLLYLLPALFLMACSTEEAHPVNEEAPNLDYFTLEVPYWLVGTWGYQPSGYNMLKPHIRFTETTVCLFDHDGTPSCLDELINAIYREDVYMPVGQGNNGTDYFIFYGEEDDFMYNHWSFHRIDSHIIEWTQTNGDILRLYKIE